MKGKNMTRDDVSKRFIEIVAIQIGIDDNEISETDRFRESLSCDSLDLIELVMECEDEFELSISDEEAEKMETVGQAIDAIIEKYNETR